MKENCTLKSVRGSTLTAEQRANICTSCMDSDNSRCTIGLQVVEDWKGLEQDKKDMVALLVARDKELKKQFEELKNKKIVIPKNVPTLDELALKIVKQEEELKQLRNKNGDIV